MARYDSETGELIVDSGPKVGDVVDLDPNEIGMSGTCGVCRIFGNNATHGAMVPLAVMGGVIPPDEYGVCDGCHEAQWLAYYGWPISERYDPKHRPSRFAK